MARAKDFYHVRPHQSLNMQPPVPETLLQSGTYQGGQTIVFSG